MVAFQTFSDSHAGRHGFEVGFSKSQKLFNRSSLYSGKDLPTASQLIIHSFFCSGGGKVFCDQLLRVSAAKY